jgi:hypothetical protein
MIPDGRRLQQAKPARRKTVSATCGLMFFKAAPVPEGCLRIQYLYNLPNLEEFVNIFVKNLPKNHVCDIITY